jgi:hypothetical protein
VLCAHHLTLSLALVTVNAGGRQVLAQQVVLQLVSTALGLNKHKGQTLQDNSTATAAVSPTNVNAASPLQAGRCHYAACKVRRTNHSLHRLRCSRNPVAAVANVRLQSIQPAHAADTNAATHVNHLDAVQHSLALLILLHILYVLCNQVGGATHAADCQENVVVQEVCRQQNTTHGRQQSLV